MASAGLSTQSILAPPTRYPGPTPPGYERDPITGALRPALGSEADTLAQRERQQKIEDEARQRGVVAQSRSQNLEDQDRAARDTLRTRLIGLLDRPEYTSSVSSAEVPAFNAAQYATAPAGTPAPTTVNVPDVSTANADIFARAKDKVGQETAGSLTALRSALASRGMLGSGGEIKGMQNIITAGQGELGDVTREQAIQDASRATDFAKMGYEGAITQRGQDIQAAQSARDAALNAARTGYEGAITQRGQNIEALNAARSGNISRNASITSLLGKLY